MRPILEGYASKMPPFDEYVYALEGRLILTLDDGRKFETKQGEAIIVPEGFTGYWYIPEKYREFIINTISSE